jgi:hypothetical protein
VGLARKLKLTRYANQKRDDLKSLFVKKAPEKKLEAILLKKWKRLFYLSAAIARLEREKEYLLAQAEELADKFAWVNFDDISALRREAFEYFKAGDIKKAIDTLKFETLLKNIDKAEEEFSWGEKLEKEGQ